MCTPYLLSTAHALVNFWDDKDEQNTATRTDLLPAFSTTATPSRAPDPYALATKGICDPPAFQRNQSATTTTSSPTTSSATTTTPSAATTTPSATTTTSSATTTTSCDNHGFLRRRHRPDMQVKQDCSDNYETKQSLTTAASPGSICAPICDSIGAVLDYCGRLYELVEPRDHAKQIKTQNQTLYHRREYPGCAQSAQHTILANFPGCAQSVQQTTSSSIHLSSVVIRATTNSCHPSDRQLSSSSTTSSTTTYSTPFPGCAESAQHTILANFPGCAQSAQQNIPFTFEQTKTQTTHDMTTQDMTAPGLRTTDTHQIRVGAEAVKLLQANITEPKIQYFSSDRYEARFDPTSIERLPNFCDAIKIVDQIVCQESKYSLYDFDVGPPYTIEEYCSSRVPEWGDCMDILVLQSSLTVSTVVVALEIPESHAGR